MNAILPLLVVFAVPPAVVVMIVNKVVQGYWLGHYSWRKEHGPTD